MRADEDLGRPTELVNFKNDIVYFTCVIFQVQRNGDFTLALDETPDVIDFCISLLI